MNKRQSQILDLLTQNKKLKVTELSEVLNVSQSFETFLYC